MPLKMFKFDVNSKKMVPGYLGVTPKGLPTETKF